MTELPSSHSMTALKGVGDKLASKLAESLGLHSLQDLLFHLPLRYEDRTRITPIAALRPMDHVVVQGEIVSSEIQFGKRRTLLCRIRDQNGLLTLRFFHFNPNQKKSMQPGKQLRAYGEVRPGPYSLELVHPEYRVLKEDENPALEQSLTPIYPTTEGINQNRLRSMIDQALDRLQKGQLLEELLPENIRRQFHLPDLRQAILAVHRPSPDMPVMDLLAGTHPAQQRLAFEELMAHNLSLLRVRQSIQIHQAPALARGGKAATQFQKNLPFQLTGAQQRVANEAAADLSQSLPMLRLVQGDVGSGKTVVAALAAMQAVDGGFQAAVMAPTEILAEQHYLNFKSWCEPLGIEVGWISGKLKGKARQQMEQKVADGTARIIVGTHALFQQSVNFESLALVVIDEQHRFGVHQRLALREKGVDGKLVPHQLIMTATPIPRTLAMTAYADLDTSVIDELPPGRTPINTVVMADTRRAQVIDRVYSACMQGKQAYWVCTLIEESEVLQCQAAETTAEQLRLTLPDLKIGLIHGRMKSVEKAEVMAQFKANQLNLLIATTVIEVGVDVPNSTLMVIENPERLGLAQLHQLRGRVGRGSQQSHCVLMYSNPLSQQSRERLAVMRESTDGFVIAKKDLELRGPGEVLGTRQTGLASLKIADLLRDQELLPAVKSASEQFMQQTQSQPQMAETLIRRWLGQKEQYGVV